MKFITAVLNVSRMSKMHCFVLLPLVSLSMVFGDTAVNWKSWNTFADNASWLISRKHGPAGDRFQAIRRVNHHRDSLDGRVNSDTLDAVVI
ncbi:MAG: hypothetical protein ACUVR8_04995 [Acidobacteriota bacterium]